MNSDSDLSSPVSMSSSQTSLSTMLDLPSRTDVVVVGAGPTGLAAACKLRKAGLDVILIDSLDAPEVTARASILHSRTLEVMEELDLTQKLLARGMSVPEFRLWDRAKKLVSLQWSTMPARYNMVLTLPQTVTEELLNEKYRELGGMVYRSHILTSIKDNGVAGVDMVIQYGEMHSESRTVHAKYVVAADGLHSFIRKSLAIPFDGAQYPQDFFAADIRIDDTVCQLNHDRVELFLSPSGLILLAPFADPANCPSSNLYRAVATLDNAPAEADQKLLDRILKERGPFTVDADANAATVVKEVIWYGRFRVHHRLAREFRKANSHIFLAGDAAHTHSPAGGQGMNVGVQDGFEAARVICDAILRGRDSEKDLSVYQNRRRPFAKGVVWITHRMTVMATLRNTVACWLRSWVIMSFTKLPGFSSWLVWRLAELGPESMLPV